jgi:threonine dehydrogenase-like Zn-dependent dehydrogenase
MKAVKAFSPQDLRLVDVPDLIPGESLVLIAVRASGICGSDIRKSLRL